MNNERVFVLGDIHGAHRALMQCFQRAKFDYSKDRLIALGDVCDGWPEVALCIDELLKIEQLQFVLGNHDYWAVKWMQDRKPPEMWLQQGGQATVNNYPQGLPKNHLTLLEEAELYFVWENRLFVHAGILPDIPIEDQDEQIFLWDRTLCNLALRLKHQSREQNFSSFQEIYIGHTPTIRYGYSLPVSSGNVWMMDTGAAWNGKLSLMDIHTKEVFQSDLVPDLYPGVKGR